MDLISPIVYVRQDECPNCQNKRSLELYDKYNNPVRYTLLLDRNETKRLSDKSLRYFRCIKCNSEFLIDFTCNDKIPRPSKDTFLKFMKRHKSYYKK